MKITKTILMLVFLVCLVPSVSASVILNMTFNSNSTYDYSVSALNSTLYGGAKWISDCGRFEDGCYFLNRSQSSYILTQNSSVFNLTRFTMMAWVKPISTAALTRAFLFKTPETNITRWGIIHSNTVYSGLIDTIGFNVNHVTYLNWTLVVLTFNGTNGQLWVGKNGTLSSSGNFAVPAYTPAVGAISIGAWIGLLGPRYFDGYVDDVRVYSNSLNYSQILAIYNYTQPVPPLPPVPPSPNHGYGIYGLLSEVGAGSYFLISLISNPLFYLFILLILVAMFSLIGMSIAVLIKKYK